MKKIALEEHFSTEELAPYLGMNRPAQSDSVMADIRRRLMDFDGMRLEAMDEGGIETMVLSTTVPGVQGEPEPGKASDLARRVNDRLAEAVRKRPTRYAGFATLPLQDPRSAAEELRRGVKELGFKGAMINGHTFGRYLDEDRFQPLWEMAEQLDVPLYLHPADPADQPAMFAGRPELQGATWVWTAETATHALRLVFGGVFRRFPRAKVILGHMGETLPFLLWRFDSRAELRSGKLPEGQRPSEIIRRHFYITTTGVCDHASLGASLANLGKDRVMFSVDYPYESCRVASDFIESAPVDEATREQVAYGNAKRLLRL